MAKDITHERYDAIWEEIKLRSRLAGPFMILRRVGEVAYMLAFAPRL